MSINIPSFAELSHRALLVEETKVSWMQHCLEQLADHAEQIGDAAQQAAVASDFWDFDQDSFLAYLRPYTVKDRVLLVPVRGVLLSKFPYTFGSWATGYEYIWAAVERGLSDDNVDGIAFIVESGGGLVDGCFELNDKIYARRGEKPIRAFADSYAYSAAYATASVADSITVTRSGGVGSIGVIITHVEYSRALDTHGVTVTPIRSKPRKAEGGPYEALSKAAQAKMQASVDFSHSEFVALVARNRGMSEADVDATDALTFLAHEAVENGLADQIGSTDDALAAFAASFNDPDTGEEPMADKNVADTLPLADHEAAVAAARVEAETAGKAAGAEAERTRVAAILDSAEAKERPAAARMMVDLGVAADQALVQLAKLPVEAATQTATGTPAGAGAPAGMLEAAMDGTPQPNVGASDDSENEVDPKEARRAARAKAAREYGLAGFKKPQD